MNKLLVFSMMMSAAIAANAEYLFWQVSDTKISGDSYLRSVITDRDTYTYKAQISYAKNGTKVGTLGSQYVIGGDGSLEDAVSVNLSSLSDASDYSYYIEIYKYQDGTMVGNSGIAQSATLQYSQLGDYTLGDLLDVPTASISTWTGGTYSAPEPTSTLMLMIGMAFLGLKRKRV